MLSLPSPARHVPRLISGLLMLAMLWVTASAALAQGYKVRAGDTLAIEVLEDGSLNRQVLVLPDGSINFPLVGSLRASGRTATQLQQQLAQGLAPSFAVVPTVFVSVASIFVPPDRPVRTPEPITIGAFVMGEVNGPGRFDVEPGTTILQILAQAGGLTRFAAERRIELRRTHPLSGTVTRFIFSYTGRGKGPLISGGTVLSEGDVVVVPARRLFE
ncbi:MAG: polysaccharide biosynthesis/export family protein [Pseudomonadota bacterium]